jgi:hypothetical protein
MRIIIGVLLITFGLAAYGAPDKDSCQFQIPEQLSTTVKQKFPEYRPPLTNDNYPDDIAWNIKDGGSGCLGVAIADFDGDGSKDYLLDLTSLSNEGGLIVVALTHGSSWDFHTLYKLKEGRKSTYVAAEKPGKFKRTEAADGPLASGELNSMTCPNWGATFGTVESSGVVHCFTKGKWHHVWVSD